MAEEARRGRVSDEELGGLAILIAKIHKQVEQRVRRETLEEIIDDLDTWRNRIVEKMESISSGSDVLH